MGDKEDWGGGNVTAMISERLPFGSAKEIKGKSKENQRKNKGTSKENQRTHKGLTKGLTKGFVTRLLS